MAYRQLTDAEIAALEAHGCSAEEWRAVTVAPGFDGLGATTEADFAGVRGTFETNPFVLAVTEHRARKDALGTLWIDRLNALAAKDLQKQETHGKGRMT